MAQQKLYTEKQVREAYNEGCWNGFNEIKDAEDYTINLLIPIELPSDEEIEKAGTDLFDKGVDIDYGWIMGAKWMRDKIQNKFTILQ
jgi:hypothetical protein